MPLRLEWPEIAIRLLCTILAGALIGWNRTEHGRAAGLRTTILVALAACLAMLQVNLLLAQTGKASDSFVELDLMRLPLGILSGIGFIGAGAIVRRDNFVVGITTAATIWFVTVLGLCFGGGQIAVGLTGLGIGMTVLTVLKVIEDGMKQDRQGLLTIVTGESGPSEQDVRANIDRAGFRISSCRFTYTPETKNTELNCALHWKSKAYASEVPAVMNVLAATPGVVRIAWAPESR
jgi:putative Mg2+ transporter-C (MgtC) family protein